MQDAPIDQLNTRQVRALALQMRQALLAKDELLQAQQRQLVFKQATIDKLTHEMAVLKRLKFAAKSEAFNAEQKSLLEDAIDADLEALRIEADQARAQAAPPAAAKDQPRRQPLPANLPRREIRHEPDNTTCRCGCALKRIGEDVAEKLDYVPGVFTVERHVRGKWVCRQCQTLVQAPVPAHVIDKGLPTTGLLAQVLVAKYADHLPLYRQEAIFERAGMALPRSTLAQWVGASGVALQPLVEALKAALFTRAVLHADETPVAMLKPGHGKTHRAYLWSYASTVFDPIKGVVFDFADSRAGRHAQAFLGADQTDGADGGWRGTLVCDDYAGYKALFGERIVEAGCLAHARRKFFELWANHQSAVAEQALTFFGDLYDVEREVQALDVDERKRIRQLKARPVADHLHAWLIAQRHKVPEGSATAKAIAYSTNRWAALTRYLDDGSLPADNNWIENRIRPIALGRANWLFAGSLRAGQRAAAIMSLIGSAKMNGLDPYVYLRDVLERLPTHPASRIEELLPHRWQPTPPH
jgi:transposase